MSVQKISTYIKYGVPQATANTLEQQGLSLTTFRKTKNALLKSLYGLDDETIAYVKKAISRKKIPDDTIFSLLHASNYKCCLCKGMNGYVIHHIIPYEKSQDNTYDNLAVLCPNCHDRAHSKGGLTNSVSPEHIRKSKQKWEAEVEKHNTDVACRSGQIEDSKLDFINIPRFLEFVHDSLSPIPDTKYTHSLHQHSAIDAAGNLTSTGNDAYSVWNKQYNPDIAFMIRSHYFELFKHILSKLDFKNLDDLLKVRILKSPGIIGTYCFYVGGLYGFAPELPITQQTKTTHLYLKKKKFYVKWAITPFYLVSMSSAMRVGGKHTHLIYGVIRRLCQHAW